MSIDTLDRFLEKAFTMYVKEEYEAVSTDTDRYPIPRKELRWARQQDRKRNGGGKAWMAGLKRCAVIALVLASVSAAVLASSVEVRAAVKEFFETWFGKIAEIFYSQEVTEESQGDIYLYDVTYIPAGYELSYKEESDAVRKYAYTNGEKRLTLEIALTDKATVSLDSDVSKYEEVWLGEHSAYVISEKGGENCAVIFGDKDITVYAGGELDREELIRIAKGINMNEADILGYVRSFSTHKADLPNVATYDYTCAIKDFDYSQEVRFDEAVVVGMRIPYNWSEDVNSCHRVLPDLSGFRIASGSSVVLFEVDKDFVLDDTFHEAVAHKYAIPSYTYESKKVSEYRTAQGLDCVIYYQYDDAENIFLTAFMRLTDTLIISIDLNDDSGNAAVMLDILDSVRLGAYDEPEREEEAAVRFNFDKLTDRQREYYLKLEKGEYAGGESFSGEDSDAMRVAVKLYRINNQYNSWRNGNIQYSVYVPDYTKNEIILNRYEVDASEGDWYYSYNERLYDLKREVVSKHINKEKTELDKARSIAELLYKNVIQTEDKNGMNSFSLGALFENRANCNGIAYAFEDLCKSVGIEVTTVHSEGSIGHYLTNDFLPHDHMWNMVKLDGRWYHVDISRMMSDRNNDDPFDAYFLISDDEIKEENGDFSLMSYGDAIESEAFRLPECPESYKKEK